MARRETLDGGMMTEAHNAAVVRRVVDAMWNQGDLDVADVLFTATYVNHAGLIPDLVHGPEAMKVSVALYRIAFPDLQITIEQLTAKRNAVVLRWTARSTPLINSASGGTRGTLIGMIVCRFADGRIAESWMHWDQPGALEQLGGIHRTGPAGRDATPAE
jgi:hypothetical protein